MENATQSALPSFVYRFGLFVLDAASGTLTRNGARVKLQDQPFRLLILLVQHAGQIVSREEIQRGLWPGNTFVEFNKSLSVAIVKVREALADDAGNPRFVETVPRRGYRFIAPVSVQDLNGTTDTGKPISDSGNRPVASAGDRTENSASRFLGLRLRYWGLALAAAILILVFGVYRYRLAPQTRQPTSRTFANVRLRRSVAVIGFRNLPGHAEDDWLSPAFAEMLNTELAADTSLRMVSGEDVARAKRELPFADEDSLAKDTLERLRNNPGADVVVLGSYTPLPGKGEKRIRLDVRLQDTAHGETILEQAFVGSEDDLFELVSQAGAALRKDLGSAPVSPEVYAQARAAMPTKPLAVRLYTEGQAHLWAFDFIHARDLLVQAISVEPDFPLAHAYLSDAWDHLGYTLKARDEADRALSLSQHLGPEERLQIEGQYYSSLQDSKHAIAIYQKLFSQFPDNLDYGLRLADHQRRVNVEDALATLKALRQLPSRLSNDPRIDILEARVWMNRDYAKVQEAGRRAIERGLAQGAHLLVAHAYGVLCQAIGNGATPAQAMEDCESARHEYAAAGDRNNEARTLNDFAGLYYQLGDLDRAKKIFREAIVVFRRVGDIEGITAASGNLGDVYLAEGNLAAAERAISDTIPGYNEMGDKDGIALALNDLAEVARRRGNLKTALATYGQAKAAAEEIDDKRALAYVLNGVGDTLADRGDFTGARSSYEESLAIRKQTGEKQTAAETELALARLALQQGRASEAETVIRNCKEQFHEDGESDDELAAEIAYIEALLAESRYPEAKNEVEQDGPLAAKSVNQVLRLQSDLASARVEGALGRLDVSRAKLQNTLKSARAHNLLGIEFETRLAIAELERKAGQDSEANTDLTALEKAARARGFGSIAANASRLLEAGAKPVADSDLRFR
jgi:DNA-binding winged helix-turn-helix (wHTH) protein/tetratricopeptide (TPR) repeat protein